MFSSHNLCPSVAFIPLYTLEFYFLGNFNIFFPILTKSNSKKKTNTVYEQHSKFLTFLLIFSFSTGRFPVPLPFPFPLAHQYRFKIISSQFPIYIHFILYNVKYDIKIHTPSTLKKLLHLHVKKGNFLFYFRLD